MNVKKEIYNKNISTRCSHVNVGSNEEFSIKQLVKIIKKVVGYNGQIQFDSTKPDGTMRKRLNSNRISKFGFKPKISLENGLKLTYRDYKKNI